MAESISRPMTLDTLLAGIARAPAVPVTDITLDSRRVVPGSVFFACRGTSAHGLDHMGTAIARGAAAIVWESDGSVSAPPSPAGIPLVAVPTLRAELGTIAHQWFDAPSERLDVFGITGTNGKTSVAWILAAALKLLGRPCAYLGTLGSGMPGALDETTLTTPDVIETHRHLAHFLDLGASHAAVEVSSHALDQGRIDGVRMHGAVFTNLSRDHLDYHGDMHHYGAAKARLMDAPGLRCRVINVDDAFGAELHRRHSRDALAVTRRGTPVSGRVLRIRDEHLATDGIRFRFDAPQGGGSVRSPLRGAFNVENLALVLGGLLECGVAVERAARALTYVNAPPGRMQTVGDGRPVVLIDYAHSPAALEAVLAAIRPHCSGRLWCVFGCGGERDRGKRPLMGLAASRADRVVVTSDNPRGEDPGHIIDEIVAGLKEPDAATAIIDRGSAIRFAIEHAGEADCVLIAGKGHERFQIDADGRRPFSDLAEASAALERRRH